MSNSSYPNNKFPVYRYGDTGPAITDIQRRLLTLGYELGADGEQGHFGDGTLEAVKKFQQDQRLDADGLVGRATWYRLLGLGYSLGDRLLYLRFPPFRGSDVSELQQLLAGLGFRVGPLDGIYGTATEKAVREFQRNMSLVVDGMVGKATIATIRNLNGILNINPKTVLPWNLVAPQPGYSHLSGRCLEIIYPRLDRGNSYGRAIRQLSAQVAHMLRIAGAKVSLNAEESLELELFTNGAGQSLKLAIGFPGSQELGHILYSETTKPFPVKRFVDAMAHTLEIICGSHIDITVWEEMEDCPALSFCLSRDDEKTICSDETRRQKIAVALTDALGRTADDIPAWTPS